MKTDVLTSMWLDDWGIGMLLCLVLFVVLTVDFLIRCLRKSDRPSMTKQKRRKAKKAYRKTAPRPWLIAAAALLLAYTFFASLPYFRDMAHPQPQTVSAKVVALSRKHINNRTRYYICTIRTEGGKTELKLSRAQTEALNPSEGLSYAFTYFPWSRTVIEAHPLVQVKSAG